MNVQPRVTGSVLRCKPHVDGVHDGMNHICKDVVGRGWIPLVEERNSGKDRVGLEKVPELLSVREALRSLLQCAGDRFA